MELTREQMTPLEIAQKYVYGEHDALTDNQEIIDMTKDIEQAKQINMYINKEDLNIIINLIEQYRLNLISEYSSDLDKNESELLKRLQTNKTNRDERGRNNKNT